VGFTFFVIPGYRVSPVGRAEGGHKAFTQLTNSSTRYLNFCRGAKGGGVKGHEFPRHGGPCSNTRWNDQPCIFQTFISYFQGEGGGGIDNNLPEGGENGENNL